MPDTVTVLSGDGEHRFIRLFYTPSLLTDGFTVGRKDCSRGVLNQNGRVLSAVVADSRILTGGYTPCHIGNQRVGIHIYKIQPCFTAPTA